MTGLSWLSSPASFPPNIGMLNRLFEWSASWVKLMWMWCSWGFMPVYGFHSNFDFCDAILWLKMTYFIRLSVLPHIRNWSARSNAADLWDRKSLSMSMARTQPFSSGQWSDTLSWWRASPIHPSLFLSLSMKASSICSRNTFPASHKRGFISTTNQRI